MVIISVKIIFYQIKIHITCEEVVKHTYTHILLNSNFEMLLRMGLEIAISAKVKVFLVLLTHFVIYIKEE